MPRSGSVASKPRTASLWFQVALPSAKQAVNRCWMAQLGTRESSIVMDVHTSNKKA